MVTERVGVARHGELVRVPLFFHEGECPEPHDLQVFAADDLSEPLAYQPDDVRRAADGSVSRMHLYFSTDLSAWQQKRFVIVKGANPGRAQPSLPLPELEDKVTLTGNDIQVTFWTTGPRRGAIAAIRTAAGKVSVTDDLLAPRLILHRQADGIISARRSEVNFSEPGQLEVRDLRYGAGPHFAKLIIRVGPVGLPDAAEFTYLVPRRGQHIIQSERIFPEEGDSTQDVVGVGGHMLLTGRLALGDSARLCRVVPVPAGLRQLTRSTCGQINNALVNAEDGISMLAIPHVQGGVTLMEMSDVGHFSLHGSADFQRTEQAHGATLRAFFGQVRLVFSRATSVDDLWEVSRAHMQPLTAVVEEPEVTVADLQQRLYRLATRLPASAENWQLEVGRLHALGATAALDRLLATAPRDQEQPEHWLAAARSARARFPHPLDEEQKGPAAGPLDPWKITCSVTPLAALAADNPRLARVCAALGKAQQHLHGLRDPNGFPYLDAHKSTLHLHLGSMAAGLSGAVLTGDDELAAYYRDCARTPTMLDIFGNGQRACQALLGGRADFHHATLCDFLLRASELSSGEDLWLHPALFGRYFDCIDVNADQQQRVSAAGWYRATYLRGQAHERHFEDWGAAPFLGLLAQPGSKPLGLTEACYYAEHLLHQPLDEMTGSILFHADRATREDVKYRAPRPVPSGPTGIESSFTRTGNRVHWQASSSPGVLGYRVYRGEGVGGPWVLLSSPGSTNGLYTTCELLDPAGQPFHHYQVTAIGADLRESRWFGQEPPTSRP